MNFSGHPNLQSTCQSLSLDIVSKAWLKLMDTALSSIFWFMLFSQTWRRKNLIFMVLFHYESRSWYSVKPELSTGYLVCWTKFELRCCQLLTVAMHLCSNHSLLYYLSWTRKLYWHLSIPEELLHFFISWIKSLKSFCWMVWSLCFQISAGTLHLRMTLSLVVLSMAFSRSWKTGFSDKAEMVSAVLGLVYFYPVFLVYSRDCLSNLQISLETWDLF